MNDFRRSRASPDQNISGSCLTFRNHFVMFTQNRRHIISKRRDDPARRFFPSEGQAVAEVILTVLSPPNANLLTTGQLDLDYLSLNHPSGVLELIRADYIHGVPLEDRHGRLQGT